MAAATDLFLTHGYTPTTIKAIARRADVAVETVYSRFQNKSNLLDAVLGPAITGDQDERPLLERPETASIRACTDQREQLRAMAHLSRGILQRTAQLHRVLDSAASSDPNAAALQQTDCQRRYEGQAAYIDMLIASGPLREGLSASEAADTYASMANPATYRLLTSDRGWTPEHYEQWLGDSLIRLLLPDPPVTST